MRSWTHGGSDDKNNHNRVKWWVWLWFSGCYGEEGGKVTMFPPPPSLRWVATTVTKVVNQLTKKGDEMLCSCFFASFFPIFGHRSVTGCIIYNTLRRVWL